MRGCFIHPLRIALLYIPINCPCSQKSYILAEFVPWIPSMLDLVNKSPKKWRKGRQNTMMYEHPNPLLLLILIENNCWKYVIDEKFILTWVHLSLKAGGQPLFIFLAKNFTDCKPLQRLYFKQTFDHFSTFLRNIIMDVLKFASPNSLK